MRVRNGPVFTGVNRPPVPFRNRPMMEMIERPETDGTLNAIRKALEGLPFVQVALVFGSIAEGRENPESDVDLGVASDRPLTSSQRMQVIEAVASKTGRPVDVVDLLSAGGPILQQAITTMGQSFERLADLGLIPSDLADQMKKAVGFRNVSIHA